MYDNKTKSVVLAVSFKKEGRGKSSSLHPNILGIYRASVGGITGTTADIRLILAVALKIGATGIIVSHNHPSGNMQPSKADEGLTKKLAASALFMDIRLLDHLIIHPNGKDYYSFAEEGLI